MIRLFTFLLSLSVSTYGYSQEIYTWIDSDGIRHFNEHPANTPADKLLILPPSTIQSQLKDISKPQAYTPQPRELPIQVSLLSPVNNETIRNNSGSINIQIGLSRNLKEAERLQLIMNSKPYGPQSTKTVWQLENVDRGSHSFLIQVVRNGKVIASSSIATVYLHRASVN